MTDKAEKFGILFNPSAGRGNALKQKARLEGLLRALEIPFDLAVTSSEENLRTLAREGTRLYSSLVGAGGDSTFQIVIEEILRCEAGTDFGLIGLGSSNDVAREFDLDSLEKACLALKRKRTKPIDLGVVESDGHSLRHFIGQANIGLGAHVNMYVEEISRKRRRLAACQGLVGTMGAMHAYRKKKVPLKLAVQTHAQKIEGRFVVAGFSNIRYWATGLLFNPSARPDDGRLDACLIRECPFLRLGRLALLARRGRHVGAREVNFLTGPEFEVHSDREFEVQADGEIIRSGRTPALFTKVRIRTLPQALRLIC